jgi:hypothetical protein
VGDFVSNPTRMLDATTPLTRDIAEACLDLRAALTAGTVTARAFCATAQSLTNGAGTNIAFLTTSWDPQNTISNGGGYMVWTAPYSGYYLVTSAVSISSSGTGEALIGLIQTGSSTAGRGGSRIPLSAALRSLSVCAILSCAVGDTVRVSVYQNTGVAQALELDTTGNKHYFEVAKL